MITHSEQLNELFTALAKFQGKVYAVGFDAKVKVQTRSGSSYTFDYATIGAMLAATQAALADNGLSVTQLIDGNTLHTIIGHSSGQYLSSGAELPFTENMTSQERGSVVTYFRRYSYGAALRLNSEKDDDGNHASGNSAMDLKEQRSASKPANEPAKAASKPAPKRGRPAAKAKDEDEEEPAEPAAKGEVSSDDIVNPKAGDKERTAVLEGLGSIEEVQAWFTNTMKAMEGGDKATFRNTWLKDVQKRMSELK